MIDKSLDFNPTERDAARLGYSPVRDALHSVKRFLRLTSPLSYRRALDTNHWTFENIQDWQEVAKTIVLQYNKSTEGTWFTDTESQGATMDGKAAGLISLFYHFFRRNVSGKAQFAYFKNKTEAFILEIGGVKIVIVDMETKDGVDNLTGNSHYKDFSNDAHAAGYLVGLYINPSDWVEFGLGSWANTYTDFYILAHWKPENNPTYPAGIDASKVAMQQEGVLGLHSWVQPIPGLIPQMDANLLLWPLSQWETFTGQKYTPGTTPPPDPIGDEIVFPETYVTATVTALPAGMNYRNCRTRPDSVGGDAGSIEGKVYLFQAYPCWQSINNAEGIWYLVELPDKSFGWVLGVMPSGVVYITLTQDPIPPVEGEPMTPEQLQRLEAVEATAAQHELEITVLQNTLPGIEFIPTHKLVTTKTGGEKLRAYPNGSEAVQVYNGAILMDLKQERGGQWLMGYQKEGIEITGWLDPALLVQL